MTALDAARARLPDAAAAYCDRIGTGDDSAMRRIAAEIAAEVTAWRSLQALAADCDPVPLLDPYLAQCVIALAVLGEPGLADLLLTPSPIVGKRTAPFPAELRPFMDAHLVERWRRTARPGTVPN